jgi:hypothetical protein
MTGVDMGTISSEDRVTYAAKLRWFDKKKYREIKNLDLGGWYEQIAYRKDLLFYLIHFSPEARTSLGLKEEDFDRIAKTPLVDCEGISKERMTLFPHLSEALLYTPERSTAVRLASVGELYSWEACAPKNLREHAQQFFGRIVRRLVDFDGKQVPLPIVRSMYARLRDASLFGSPKADIQEGDRSDESYAWQSWMDDPLHSHFELGGKIAILVDLFVADSVVTEQVMDAVRTARTSSATMDARTKDKIHTWGDIGLLQYIDIMIWKHLNGEDDIPDAILRETIRDQSGDPKVVKKHEIGSVTKDAYRRLMLCDDLYNVLAAAALHERAVPSSAVIKKRRKGKVSIKSSKS